ncbi:MAG TPA: HAMP domain-containing sensor histidine kinase [Propionibacteriaceae bacterium]|nr:HAMP domain-containing sensor histidine kinase [Propionibacteriaceae bacterium]
MRLPIRWRVAAAFSAVLATVVLGIGVFVFWRVSTELDGGLDRSLQARAREVAGLVDQVGPNLTTPGRPTLEADEQVAQILRADGTVVAGSSSAGFSLLDPGRLQAALAGPVSWDRPGDDVLDEDLRLLAIPVTRPSGTYVVVVGSSLDERTEPLTALLVAEVVGLAIAVLAAGGAGYAIAGLALRPVREALQRERRFVAEASHQLRTPLTIITSEIELAQLTPGDHDAHAATLRSVSEEADRMARLADQLVLLAAADEQRLVGPREPTQVADLLHATAERHRPHAAGLDRSITVLADPELVVPADRARLEVALDSLVENALQHGAGDVELGGNAVGGQVVLSVRDRGAGFPAAVAAEAFERFRRGSRSSGTGLGLAIVQAVARAHGGQATIAPAADGNTVSISLPHQVLAR